MDQDVKREIEILTKKIKEITAIYHHAAKKNGISDSEFCILYSLVTAEIGCTQKDICDIWSFPKQTVNSGIVSLTKKDYITLENEEGTGNRKTIKLTKIGKENAEKIVNNISESEQKAFLMMTKKEREDLISLVEKYTRCLKENIYE